MPFDINGYTLDNCPSCGRVPEMLIFGSKQLHLSPESMTIVIQCPRGCLHVAHHSPEVNNQEIEKTTEQWFLEVRRYRLTDRGNPRKCFTFDLPPKEIILRMAEGNPGAAKAIMEMSRYYPLNSLLMELDYYHIYGERIYMLWNDCCDRDANWAIQTLRFFKDNNIPHSVIHANFDKGRATPFIPKPKVTEEEAES